jgi:hypothetical protein
LKRKTKYREGERDERCNGKTKYRVREEREREERECG